MDFSLRSASALVAKGESGWLTKPTLPFGQLSKPLSSNSRKANWIGDHLAEEIASLGRNQQNELNSRLRLLIAHLLKMDHQPDMRTPSWRTTIVVQRQAIADLLETSPSLRHQIDHGLQAQVLG